MFKKATCIALLAAILTSCGDVDSSGSSLVSYATTTTTAATTSGTTTAPETETTTTTTTEATTTETTTTTEDTTTTTTTTTTSATTTTTTSKAVSAAVTTPAPITPVKTNSEIDAFFSESAFVGTSIGEGLKYYFQSQGSGYLGSPLMLVKGCYGLYYDDGQRGTSYMLNYKGYTAPARDCIKMSGVKRVFISIGTNDMFGTADYIFGMYKTYIEKIRATNPDVTIFIESLTPMAKVGERGYLNNQNITALNTLLAQYCTTQPDMYYIDIASPMMDSTGCLNMSYSSDNYVHLKTAAYQIWTNVLINYISNLLNAQKQATEAVDKYIASKDAADLANAKSLTGALKDCKLKTALLGKLTAAETENNNNTGE